LLIAGLPLAMMTMHLSWGAAFLSSLIGIRVHSDTHTNGASKT
jgi:hypothetical protein